MSSSQPSFFSEPECNTPNEFTKNINKKHLLQDLFKAYYSARKNKRRTNSQMLFERKYEENIIELWEEIIHGRYHPLPSTVFIKTKPVMREVFAAKFKDRIIHHYLFNILSPLYEKDFIKDSYSCRKGKGTLYGIHRVQGFLKDMHHFGHRDAYILKLDIQNYFYSLDRSLLFTMICEKIESEIPLGYEKEIVLFLLKKVIFNDPTKGVDKKGSNQEWARLPKSKSLFNAKKGKGLAIGNLTSQLFSNIYLNEFDHFVQNHLNIDCYGRYVDDFVLIHPSKEYLKSCIPQIKSFLSSLGLTIHPKKIYLQHYKVGLPFLGAYIKPFMRYTEKRTKRNAFSCIHTINKKIPSCSTQELQEFQSSINSYLGTMIHHQTFNLRKKIIHSLSPCFWKYFTPGLDYEAVRIQSAYK